MRSLRDGGAKTHGVGCAPEWKETGTLRWA